MPMNELDESIVALRDECIAKGATMQRFFLGIGEESGEVQGAFNKYNSGRADKSKDVDDIIEEMAQLIACTLVAASALGVEPTVVMEEVVKFARMKINNVS